MAVTLLQHKATEESWQSFGRLFQLQSIATELARIASATERYGDKNTRTEGAYKRCFDLINLTIRDPKWRESVTPLYALRDAIGALYVGEWQPSAFTRALSELIKLTGSIKE